jgi:autotransporter-associated beta strand protein
MIPNWLKKWRKQVAGPCQPHSFSSSRSRIRLEELETRTLPSFSLLGNVSVGAFGHSAAVADFNGDGKPDLAVTSYYNNVKVFLANGDGTFQAPETLTAGNYTYGIAVADLNGDGSPDLIVGNFRSGTISVFLGFSNGTFQAAQNFSVGTGPEGIAVGDFNGDGKPDIAVANRNSGTISVLLNTFGSTSLFAPAVNYAIDGGPKSVIAADLNNDGKLDLVSVNITSNTVSVLLNNGNGTFQAAQNISVGSMPFSVAAGDLNGDGKVDLAVADSGASTVSLLIGNGDGTFQAAQNVSAGLNPDVVAIADINDNGLLSLVVSNPNQSGVSVLFGNGNGTFLSPKFFGVGTFQYPTQIVLADLTGDGLPDILAVNPGAHTVSVLLNTGAPPFQPLLSSAPVPNPYGLAAADLNGDGIPDLAVTTSANNSVNILLGNGDGTFSDPLSFLVGTNPGQVAIGDLNGDGKLDLVVADTGSKSISVLLGNGNGTFAAAVNISDATYPSAVALADVNGDGKLDVITLGQTGIVSLFLGNGDGTLRTPFTLATGLSFPTGLAVTDINGDKKLDIIATGSNSIVGSLGNGDGTFQPVQTLFNGFGLGLESLAVADFNGDGKADLAVGEYSYQVPGRVLLLLGNGNGTFQAARNLSTGIEVSAVAAADVNGDGRMDLITTNRVDGTISVLQGNGNGTFQAAQNINAGVTPRALAVADFNVDGRPDIAVVDDFSESVGILLRNSTSQFQINTRTLAVAGNSIPVTVSALDAQNRVDGRFTGTVTLSSSDPQFVGPGPYTFTPQDQGKHTFTVTLKTAGFQRLSVTDGKNSATSNIVLVQPAAASSLFLPQPPLDSIVGSPIPPLSVQLLDPFGNVSNSTASVSMTIALGPAGGTFTTGSTTTVAASNGVATFSNLAFTAPGVYKLSASSAGLIGAISSNFSISVATTRTWSGKGPDDVWGDPANWVENIAPTAGDDLFFPDNALQIATCTNNFAPGITFNSINFTGVNGGYDLLSGTMLGTSIVLKGGINSNAGINKIDLKQIVLNSSQTYQAANSSLAISSAIGLQGFTLTLDGLQAPTGFDSLTGIISGSGAIIKNGASEWLVSGTNSFTGPVTINNGTLAVNNSSSLGAAANAVTVNPGSAGTGSLQVFNNISVLQPLTINGNGNNLSPGAIDIRDTTLNDTFGAISLGSAASIVSANIGVNTMTLTGAIQNNGFDLSIVGAGGYTTILSNTATVSGTGHVLNFGSIFSGTGTLNSALNVNQGTLSPGSGGNPGTLNSSDVNFGIGTNFNPILGNSSNSLLNSTGSVNLSGSNLSLSFQSGFVPNPGQSYVIITATGSINGTFNGLPDGAPIVVNGQQFLIRYLNSSASSLHPSAINGRTVIFPVPASTTTSLFASPNPVIAGQPETFTAIVTSPAAAAAGVSSSVITGTVNFFDGGILIGSGQVTGGAAVFTTTSLGAGNHSITATYNGSPTFSASNTNASPIALTVNNGSVGWQDVTTGNFTAGKDSDIAGMTAGGQWWVAVSNGSKFSNQFWGTWPVATWVDVQTGDFNGDGLTDIAGRNSQTGQWYVAQSTGSSFNTTIWTTWNPNVTWVDVKVGDFNGDGKSDIAGRFLQTGQWFVAQSTGSSFTSSLWGTWNPNVTWVDVNFGTFAGNKTSDITGRWLQGGSWWTAVSNGSSFTTSLWAQWNPNVTWVDIKAGDFNGDTKTDITARYSQTGQWWTAVSTGSSFNTTLWATWNPNLDWVDVKVGDFNGDGKADITARWLDTGEWFTGLSTGSAFLTSMWDMWSPAVTWVDVNVGDVNGDGVPDLVGRIQQNGQWWAALSNGSTAFTNQLWTTWAV